MNKFLINYLTYKTEIFAVNSALVEIHSDFLQDGL